MKTGIQLHMNTHSRWYGLALMLLMLVVASPASATSWFWPQKKTGTMSTVLVTPEPATQVYAPLPPIKVPPRGVWGSPTDAAHMTLRDQQAQIKVMKKRTAAMKASMLAEQEKEERYKRIMAEANNLYPRVAQPVPARTSIKAPQSPKVPVTRPVQVIPPVAPTTVKPILPRAPAYQAPRVPAGDWEKISPNPGTGTGNGIQPIIIPNRNLKTKQPSPQPNAPQAGQQQGAPATNGAAQ